MGTEESPHVSTKTPSASFRDPQNRGLGLWEVTDGERPGPWEQEVGSGMPGICLLFGGQSLRSWTRTWQQCGRKDRPSPTQGRGGHGTYSHARPLRLPHKKLSAGWATSELGDLWANLPIWASVYSPWEVTWRVGGLHPCSYLPGVPENMGLCLPYR